MRTLVVSDLHLGAHRRRDVLREPAAVEPLAAAARGCDRLVLLGDVLELRHGPVRDALAVARPVLEALGEALGPEREVVVVAGNHDHELFAGWFERRGRNGPPAELALETEVDSEPGEPLDTLVRWLAPARVRALYPGVWLREDVYATHGQYGDLHMTVPTLERLAAGIMRRVVGLPHDGPRSLEEYELALAPLYAWAHAIAQRIEPARGGHLHRGSVRGWEALTRPGPLTLRGLVVALGFPAVVAALNWAGVGPLQAELTGPALRRAGLRGFEASARRLRMDAPHLVFGHTHRAGPLPGDEVDEWITAAGSRLHNSGCWVREPSFLGPDPARSPYRPGFAVRLEERGPPELVNLLDGAGGVGGVSEPPPG